MTVLFIKSLYNLDVNYDVRSGHSGDAGLDLYVPADITCLPNQVTFIGHGISCEMVDEYYEVVDDFDPLPCKNISYLLVPRSSISKTPLIMANSIGIIDAGYRGEIIAAVYNTSNENYIVKKGTRLFQIILPSLNEFGVKISSNLTESSRGEGGFGSTGY